MKRHPAFLLCLLLAAALSAVPCRLSAQDGKSMDPTRYVRSGGVVGIGFMPTCFDTYLSPNRYAGLLIDVGLEQWHRANRGDGRLFVQTFSHTTVGLGTCAVSSSELLAMEDLSYALPWQWYENDWLRLYAGGEAQMRLGGIWNTRNSNNPANVKAGVHVGGMAMAEFRYRLGRLPVRSAVTFDMPLLGAVFSPEYTQSYYELFYLGSDTPCIHFASLHNGLSGRGMLVTDITLRNSILRLSLMEDNYRWQTSTNRYALHTFTLGVGFVFNAYHILPRETAASLLPY